MRLGIWNRLPPLDLRSTTPQYGHSISNSPNQMEPGVCHGVDQDRHSLRNPVRVWCMEWGNVCGFQGLVGRPASLGQGA